jgi:hypothetical protein
MLFYRKGLWGRKIPLPFVVYARKAVILRGQIWSTHESDVVGLRALPQWFRAFFVAAAAVINGAQGNDLQGEAARTKAQRVAQIPLRADDIG